MKRNTRDTRGQCTRRRKVINLKGIKPASHRTPGVRDKLAARPPSSPVYSNDSNARGLRSLWRPRRRNLDPRNTMDPRWQPLLPICPRFRPCSSVRGSFPNPIISVRRAGGGEKEDYLDSRDFLDNRNKEGIGIFFLFLFRCLVLDRIRWWDFSSARVIWKNVKFIIRIR